MGLAHRSLVSLCHSLFPFLSFSLSPSFRMTPWGTGALWIHFFAWASKTRSGRRPASSSGRGRPASSPHQEGPCGLHEWSKFYVNQGRSSLFLSPFTFLIADTVILRDSLDPAGAGPQQPSIFSHHNIMRLEINYKKKLQKTQTHGG